MDIAQESLRLHEQWQGKLETVPKMKIETREDLALAYTPGVAEPCRKIAENPSDAYKYTMKANTVAVVSDGSAVLGLGNIGPAAAMPVMEGKCALFKTFGGVNAVPLCLDTQDVDEIVETVKRLAPSFGGINLEDISAPRCFEIERRLIDELDIPVFHDDQHGTAIVVLSGVINALRLTGKQKEACRVVVNGAGSAGIAIAKLLLNYGFRNLILCDKCGIINSRSEGINEAQRAMLATTNLNDEEGTLADAMRGADIFVGVSAPGIVSAEMVKSMNSDAILFAMANPTPEIFPDVARAAGARVVGTGRSDFPNQINNVVAFPGIFKGALESRATRITKQMKLAAAEALAALVSDDELCEDFIMPEPFDPRAVEAVAAAVAGAVQGEQRGRYPQHGHRERGADDARGPSGLGRPGAPGCSCTSCRSGAFRRAGARARRVRHVRGRRRRRQDHPYPLSGQRPFRHGPRGRVPSRARRHRGGRAAARRGAEPGELRYLRCFRAARLRGGTRAAGQPGHSPGARARGCGAVRPLHRFHRGLSRLWARA